MICCANSMATRFWASRVLAPRWGVQITDGCSINFKSTGGSSSKTSRAAPAHWPEFNASRRAFSSMIPPRATLTNLTPRLHNDKTWLLIRSNVMKWVDLPIWWRRRDTITHDELLPSTEREQWCNRTMATGLPTRRIPRQTWHFVHPRWLDHSRWSKQISSTIETRETCADDLHIKRLHSFGNFSSDSSQADDGQCFAIQFFTHECRSLPLAWFQWTACVGNTSAWAKKDNQSVSFVPPSLLHVHLANEQISAHVCSAAESVFPPGVLNVSIEIYDDHPWVRMNKLHH